MEREPEMRNAIITGTSLGKEDHGIFTGMVFLDYGSMAQGFGGYYLDSYSTELKKRVPSKSAGLFIQRVLEVVGVTNWEELRGKHVRVMSTSMKVHAIGHFLKDVWFYPDEELIAMNHKEEPTVENPEKEELVALDTED